jgi:hypothetical protein
LSKLNHEKTDEIADRSGNFRQRFLADRRKNGPRAKKRGYGFLSRLGYRTAIAAIVARCRRILLNINLKSAVLYT